MWVAFSPLFSFCSQTICRYSSRHVGVMLKIYLNNLYPHGSDISNIFVILCGCSLVAIVQSTVATLRSCCTYYQVSVVANTGYSSIKINIQEFNLNGFIPICSFSCFCHYLFDIFHIPIFRC